MRKLLLLLGAAVVLLAGFILARTVRYGSDRPAVEQAPDVAIPAGAAERLAGSVRIPTISHEGSAAFDADAFRALHAYLQTAFRGCIRSSSARLCARTASSTPGAGAMRRSSRSCWRATWTWYRSSRGRKRNGRRRQFGGRIAGGFIWGRGAIDNKSAVVGTLEAVEMLLGEGFRPARTVYLAYGHDEEVGGTGGAREIAALLKRRGVELEMVLDEGGVIGQGILPGISAPVALVGIAEKGFVSVELSARTAGGHSSMPPPQSTIGILSAAIARLEAAAMPARLEGPTRQLFDRIGPELPFAQRAVFANLWLTRPLVIRNLERSPATNAMVRTTTAATVFQAGTKDNVLPGYGRAVINFRILPGDSVAGVVEHVRRVIDDGHVAVRTVGAFSAEPAAVSSSESESFRRLERTIRSVAPDAIVAPYLVVVVTDARYYGGLSSEVFRFLPLRLTGRDLDRMHGTDERIAVPHYEDAIRTYRQLILNAAGS